LEIILIDFLQLLIKLRLLSVLIWA